MWFNSLAFKLLRQECTRLRSEVRRRDRTINELLDKFVHHRSPERLATRDPSTFTPPTTAGDAYSAAMEDADRLVDERIKKEQISG